MRYHLATLTIVVGGLVLMGSACTPPTTDTTTNSVSTVAKVTNTESSTNQPSVSKTVDCPVPVNNAELYFYTSTDGISFSKLNFVQSRTSVPNLLYQPDEDRFVLTFQSFENDSSLCDRMAYTYLSTDGEVLQPIAPLAVESTTYFNGFDPTLVYVGDQLVLAYTVRPPGKQFPCISLAVANSADLADGLTNLEQILWCSDGDNENYMDPSAVVVNEGGTDYLYLYTPSDSAMASSTPESYYAKVDISASEPTDWEIIDTGSITDAGIFLLGEMVAQADVTDCPYAIYGTFQNSIRRACSEDGKIFGDTATITSPGADPGVARDSTGAYALVYSAE